MRYLRVRWLHSFPDQPTLLYSELDDERYECRKIDIYPDGRWGFADAQEEVGGTGLGEVATPAVDEINVDPEFEAVEIGRDEFENLWSARRGASVMTDFPVTSSTEDVASVDQEAIAEVLKHSKPGSVYKVDHYLYFRSSEDANVAAGQLRAKGFSTEERLGAFGEDWLVLASHSIVLSESEIAATRQLMESVATPLSGEYDGWEAEV